jgi:hypothetical protein
MLPEQQVGCVTQELSGYASKPLRRKLTGAIQWIVLLLIATFVGAIYVGLYSWGFFLGGNFHPLPYWAGWGKMHSTSARDYLLYVAVWPSTRPLETIIPHTFVKGRADLCMPNGQTFHMNLSGEMRPHIFLNTLGEPIELDMVNWRAPAAFGQQSRPSFSIWGRWSRGEITGEDRQSLSKNFLPDGQLRPANTYAAPAQMEDLRVALHEGTFYEWKSACGIPAAPNRGSR